MVIGNMLTQISHKKPTIQDIFTTLERIKSGKFSFRNSKKRMGANKVEINSIFHFKL